MQVVHLFHIQVKQNLSEEKEDDGCWGGGEDQGGVTVPGEPVPGEHKTCIDMQLAAHSSVLAVSVCVCVCVFACKAQKWRDVGSQKGDRFEATERYLRNSLLSQQILGI